MFRATTRFTIPLVAGAAAFGLNPLRKSMFDSPNPPKETLDQIKQNPLYQSLSQDPSFTIQDARKEFPKQHHNNLVTAGLLYGDKLFEIDPIVFTNNKGKLYAFHYIGEKLVSEDGKVHNGITSTLLDEGLCATGFPLLPSKKGVTAKLEIDFINQAPANSPVLLQAQVVEHSRRKVVIEGSLQTLNAPPVTIATANCVLVEPRWFKYVSWLQYI